MSVISLHLIKFKALFKQYFLCKVFEMYFLNKHIRFLLKYIIVYLMHLADEFKHKTLIILDAILIM